MPSVWWRSSFAFALALAVALLVGEAVVQSSFLAPGNWPQELATFAPFAILAMASTPAILSGGGGIDLSVGPLATVVNCVLVSWLIPHGVPAGLCVAIALGAGALVGAINGVLVSVLRYQPVIATLCGLFILAGLAIQIAPDPQPVGSNWTGSLAASVGFLPGAVITIGVPALIWLALRRTAFHRTLMAVGGDDAAAYSAGVNVTATRIAAYTLGGIFAAIAGIALTALVQSSAAAESTQYALVALAGVALGGVSLGGGRGAMVGALLGAACIYLLQQVLSSAGIASTYLQLLYGALLIVGVVLGAGLQRRGARS